MKESTKKFILQFCRKVIEKFVKEKKVEKLPPKYPEELKEKRGVFVTLYEDGELRGCIGLPYPNRSAIENLIEAAIGVTNDPRFPPLTAEELEKIKIEVSILTEPELIKVKRPIDYLHAMEEGLDGVIIKKGWNQGLFLPQVWEQIPDKLEFLEHLCMKAGLDKDEWKSKDVQLYKFRVEAIEE